MQCKADIVGILDMDGFLNGKKFFCKELGVIKVGESEASSFFFDIGLHRNELNEIYNCHQRRTLRTGFAGESPYSGRKFEMLQLSQS
jgi:hypothetical protein